MSIILGVDEAGRGPLAGPVTAGCVVFPDSYENPFIADSKKLSENKRDELFDVIKRDALCWSVVNINHQKIDELNILAATKLAMFYAVERVYWELHEHYDNLDSQIKILIDGNQKITPLLNSDFGANLYQEPIVKGDAKVLQISAASILAKVTRDRIMLLLAKKYPNYAFETHKGYPTKEHYNRIEKYGICPVHRRSFIH